MSVFLVVVCVFLVLLLAVIVYRLSRIQSVLVSILNQNLNMRDDSLEVQKTLYKMYDRL